MILYRKLENVYREIEKLNNDFGTNKKVETHLHTPASYDYRLIEKEGDNYYKNIKAKDIVEIMLKEKYINNIIFEKILNIIENKEEIKLIKEKVFKDYKEYFSYMLLIYKLIEKNVQVVFVCDHNNVDGFSKIKKARDEIVKMKGRKYFIHIFMGVEISCADKNHVIGIIDSRREENLKEYLKEIINDPKDGTYKTAYDVMNDLNNKFDAITYIAHIDSSDIFKSSGAYKKILFSSKNISILGLSNLDKQEYIEGKIEKYNQQVNFIHDGDSHGIDTIGKKNVWIKFCKVNFNSLKKAFINFNTCISNELPKDNENYIKGIYIKSGQGFLNTKNNEKFFKINFSKDLNCIIGGRGTGKSTILKIIEMAFTLNVDNLGILKVISKHDELYIVFCINNKEYILEIIPQVEYIKNTLMFADRDLNYKSNNYKDINLNEYWRKLYSISYDKKEKRRIYNKENIKIAENFFTRTYSVNQLVNRVQNGEFSGVIRNIVTNNLNIEEFNMNIIKKLTANNYSKTKEIIININDILEKRKEKVTNQINKFNNIYKRSIQIEYDEDGNYKNYILPFDIKYEDIKSINNTIVDIKDIQSLINAQINKIGILKYITYLIDKKYNELEKIISLNQFKRELSVDDINNGLRDINIKDITNIYDEIYQKILFYNNIKSIIEDIIIKDAKYNLLFNISNKETNEDVKDEFRPIQEISLGQQVAAILTFVIEYGKFNNDSTPLVIDQPEDNLDNQYIYKNLVQALRIIKNERQVIIATHSSTIVTNADSEQVIVMESNNKNGWIKRRGYASDEHILKHIVNYMEGGKESFNHKIRIYSDILK